MLTAVQAADAEGPRDIVAPKSQGRRGRLMLHVEGEEKNSCLGKLNVLA